jgi:hypothetical protein
MHCSNGGENAMFFYYAGRTFTVKVSGSRPMYVQCVGCKNIYAYTLSGWAEGSGHAPYYLGQESAKERAASSARANLERYLANRVEPIYCRRCGLYQPDMIQELRRRTANTLTDYNKFASLRVTIPRDSLYRTITSAPSIEGFEKFLSVWPLDRDAQRLGELLRKMKWRAGPGPRITKAGLGLGACVVLAALALYAVKSDTFSGWRAIDKQSTVVP